MSTNPNVQVPMMPDVRAVRREAWQRTAILRWPFHLIFAVMLSVITPLWLCGVLSGKWGALFPLVMGLWGIAVGLFPRQILRAFCGSKTPMVYARGDTGFIQSGAGARFRYIAIVIGGGVIGLLAAIVLQQPGVDALFGRLLAILLGLVIIATGLSYARTRLWESIFSIAVISGYTNRFFEGMLGEVSPIQEKALQTIARQTKELYGLINSVLQVSCIEAQMLQAEFHEVNFWELLAELRAFYDYPLGKEVKLVWDFLPDLPTLRADRGKVKHILENLVNNGIKFTEKGSVTISTRYHPAKKSMEFKIADTGIGIAKEQLPLIFEKFRQLDGSETRTYGGVGLGLYIVNQYTALLGGTIETESILGQGTTFKLTIPSKAKSLGAALEPSALSVAAGVA